MVLQVELRDQSKPGNTCKWFRLVLEGSMRVAFNLNGCKKLKQNSFSNITAMEINLIFEFNNTKFFITHQLGHLQI